MQPINFSFHSVDWYSNRKILHFNIIWRESKQSKSISNWIAESLSGSYSRFEIESEQNNDAVEGFVWNIWSNRQWEPKLNTQVEVYMLDDVYRLDGVYSRF